MTTLTTQEQLLAAFAALPPKAQRQVLDFIAFLHQQTQEQKVAQHNTEVDWGVRWEQWFAAAEEIPRPDRDCPPRDEYASLVVEPYHSQGLGQ
ncbi:MAG: DUF2281 domain-containing protein [Oscillatoriales cyanobacterium SM2_2_1]|nr:DUF2281 domain-containing protein [Oscillatoriales cyanobacterium SM2_2_1]